MTVLIAGGGIAGLALGLTCHQIGAPFKIFESVDEVKPLGVGINLQPSAVRELFRSRTGAVPRRHWRPHPRLRHVHQDRIGDLDRAPGDLAGYKWPQYSVHRGMLHMMLYEQLLKRAGPDCFETGWSATGFETSDARAVLHLENRAGETRTETGTLLLGADGIHSAIRARMAPDEGPPAWGGFILWRGTTRMKPFLTGASMVMVGYDAQRFVSYPISESDPGTGEALVNWIASIKFNMDDFLPRYGEWVFDWLDVPAMVRASDRIYEYPMVDRDPLDRWTHGRVSLIGDAAHAAYPVGSNGAGQAIVDARKLGAAFLAHGLTEQALQVYEDEMRPATEKVIYANRGGGGPDAILDVIEELCGGVFDDIHDVMPYEDLKNHADKYKKLAGFSIDELNALPPLIPATARL